jgi:hypothetical protein
MHMTQESTEQRTQSRSRLPLGLALAAGLVGVVAIAAGVAAGGPSGTASGAANAVPLIAAASPTPSADADGRRGPGGGPGMDGMRGMHGMRGAVTVAAIDGTRLSLRTDDGWTRTIDASGATISKEGATASLADIKVGDEVVFAQQRNADGTYTITNVTIVQPHVGGAVTATSASSITLKDRDGATVTVQVTSATTYEVAGKSNATLADVTVGAMVMASGTKNADGSLTATTVRAFTPGQGGPGMDGRGGGRHGGPWDGQGGPQDQQTQPNASAAPGA